MFYFLLNKKSNQLQRAGIAMEILYVLGIV